jgi:dTMP kinase
VLCDRFTDATFAYQGGGRGFYLSVLSTLEGWVQEGRQPDLTLLFDLPPEVAAARLSQARQPDRFEALDTRFFDQVRAGYLARATAMPQRFATIQADRTPEQVAAQIAEALATRGFA